MTDDERTRMSIEEIRKRDKEAIPRLGTPEENPLLQAELDRRYLLKHIDNTVYDQDYITSLSSDELRKLADYLDALESADEIATSMESKFGIHSSIFYNEYTYDKKVENDDYLFPVIADNHVLGQIGIGESGRVSLYIIAPKFVSGDEK